jgi:hypothetical protein
MRSTTAGLLVAAVLGVGLASACGTRNDATGTADAGTKSAAGVEHLGKAPSGKADGAPADDLRFPGTTVTAELTGFDQRLQMVYFELVELTPGTGEMEPHYVDVPGDGPHRLPLATNLKVWSASSICPARSDNGATIDDQGLGDQPCTKDELLDALDTRPGITARLKVDAQDRIYEVAELYHP